MTLLREKIEEQFSKNTSSSECMILCTHGVVSKTLAHQVRVLRLLYVGIMCTTCTGTGTCRISACHRLALYTLH